MWGAMITDRADLCPLSSSIAHATFRTRNLLYTLKRLKKFRMAPAQLLRGIRT